VVVVASPINRSGKPRLTHVIHNSFPDRWLVPFSEWSLGFVGLIGLVLFILGSIEWRELFMTDGLSCFFGGAFFLLRS
jgi:hypothetical protein